MPLIADYRIIRDTTVDLSGAAGGDIDVDFDFTPTTDADLGSRSILSFVVFVPEATKLIKVSVRFNGGLVRTYDFNGRSHFAIQEVIQGNVLKAGNNNISFTIARGAGDVQISDVVLFYRRNIDD